MTREEIIRGLECCDALHNGGKVQCATKCPYWNRRDDGSTDNNCRGNLLHDALVLLKAEAPRLLTAEDFEEGESVPCWKEPKSSTRRHGWAVIVYGKWLADRDVARYWTARPTAEQMEATPWPGA